MKELLYSTIEGLDVLVEIGNAVCNTEFEFKNCSIFDDCILSGNNRIDIHWDDVKNVEYSSNENETSFKLYYAYDNYLIIMAFPT